jgi:hypothetical protein
VYDAAPNRYRRSVRARDDRLVETQVTFGEQVQRHGQADLHRERLPRRYIEDSHGNFDWSAPDDEVFAFITDLLRSVGTYLYGRRMYETMAVWETDPAVAAQSELRGDFALVWQAASKVVYSTTLHDVSTAKTQLERNF